MAAIKRTDSMDSNSSRLSVGSIRSYLNFVSKKPDRNWEPIVVYEALDKKMYLEDRSRVKKLKNVTKVEVNVGKDTTVDICMPYGPSDNSINMPIATLDLSKLGKEFKKNKDKIRHVYVVGRTPMSPIDEKNEDGQRKDSAS